MKLSLVVLAALIGLASTASAMGKFAKKPDVLETMNHVGVKSNQVPLLGLLELLGALGLLAGIWSTPLGVAASTGLAIYFLGAIVAHLRVGDRIRRRACPVL